MGFVVDFSPEPEYKGRSSDGWACEKEGQMEWCILGCMAWYWWVALFAGIFILLCFVTPIFDVIAFMFECIVDAITE